MSKSYYQKFLESGESYRTLDYLDDDAYAIIMYGDVAFKNDIEGETHFNLIEKIITYYKYGSGTAPISVFGNEDTKNQLFEQSLTTVTQTLRSQIKSTHCRIWTNSKVFAFWEESPKISGDNLSVISEICDEFGGAVAFKFHTEELDSKEGTDEDSYSWGEFVEATKSNFVYDTEEIERKRNAHLMDGKAKRKILGQGIKRPVKKDPFAKYLMPAESTIKESPDWFLNKNNGMDDPYTIPSASGFIVDKDGNGIIGRSMTHAQIQHVLWATSGNAEIRDIYTSKELVKYYQMSLLLSFYKDGEDAMVKDISFNMKADENYNNNVRFSLEKYAVGRFFPNSKGVSFWNTNEQLNNAQRNAIVQMLNSFGYKADDFTFETGPLEIQMKVNEFLKEPKKNNKKPVEDNLLDLDKELHTMTDPKVKKMFRDQRSKSRKPITGKKHQVPWEWKRLIRQESSDTFKYYAFDWDDNLLFMPTTIIAEDSKGNLVPLSTREYSLIKEQVYNNKKAVVRGNIISKFSDDSYINFRESSDKIFLEDIKNAKLGPAFPDLVEAINNGRIFSIITARGHNPKTFSKAIKYMISEGMGGLNYYTCIDSLRNYKEANHHTDEELYENYIENLCKYYPVSHESLFTGGDIHEMKVDAIHDFIIHLEEQFTKFPTEFKNKVSNNFIIGFSDDDAKNIQTITEATFKKEVEVYFTGSGNMKRI